MLVMVEPGLRSINIASQIAKLAKDIGVTNIQVVLNKIRNPEDSKLVRQQLDHLGLPVIGELPQSKQSPL